MNKFIVKDTRENSRGSQAKAIEVTHEGGWSRNAIEIAHKSGMRMIISREDWIRAVTIAENLQHMFHKDIDWGYGKHNHYVPVGKVPMIKMYRTLSNGKYSLKEAKMIIEAAME